MVREKDLVLPRLVSRVQRKLWVLQLIVPVDASEPVCSPPPVVSSPTESG